MIASKARILLLGILAIVTSLGVIAYGSCPMPTDGLDREDRSDPILGVDEILRRLMILEHKVEELAEEVTQQAWLSTQTDPRREAVNTSEPTDDMEAFAKVRGQIAAIVNEEVRLIGRERVSKAIGDWVASLAEELLLDGSIERELTTLFHAEFTKEIEYRQLPRGDSRRQDAYRQRSEARAERKAIVEMRLGEEMNQTIQERWYRYLPRLLYLSSGIADGGEH